MAAINRKYKRVPYNLGYIGVIIFVVWGALMVYLGTNAPTTPDEIVGRIYPLNYHGTIVYLTLTEKVLQYALPGGAFLYGLILKIIDHYLKKKDKSWPPDDIFEN